MPMTQMEASAKTAALLAQPKPKSQEDALDRVVKVMDANSMSMQQDIGFMTERLEERGLIDGLLMFQETKERADLDKFDKNSDYYKNHPLTQKRYHWSTLWTELKPGMSPHPDAGKTTTLNSVLFKGLKDLSKWNVNSPRDESREQADPLQYFNHSAPGGGPGAPAPNGALYGAPNNLPKQAGAAYGKPTLVPVNAAILQHNAQYAAQQQQQQQQQMMMVAPNGQQVVQGQPVVMVQQQQGQKQSQKANYWA